MPLLHPQRGFSLLETLITLVISSILLLGTFKTFTNFTLQHKTITAEQAQLAAITTTNLTLDQMFQNAGAGFFQNGKPICTTLWHNFLQGLIWDDRLPFYPIYLNKGYDTAILAKTTNPSPPIVISSFLNTQVSPTPLVKPMPDLSSATISGYSNINVGDQVLIGQNASSPTSACIIRTVTSTTYDASTKATTLLFDLIGQNNGTSTAVPVSRASPLKTSYATGDLVYPIKYLVSYEIGVRTPNTLYRRLITSQNIDGQNIATFEIPLSTFGYKVYQPSTQSWINPGTNPTNPADLSAIRISYSTPVPNLFFKPPNCNNAPQLFGETTSPHSSISNPACRKYLNSDHVIPFFNVTLNTP